MRQVDQTVAGCWCIENTAEFILGVLISAKREAGSYNCCWPHIDTTRRVAVAGSVCFPIALRERAAAAPACQCRTLEIGGKGASIKVRIRVRKSTEHVSRAALQRLTRAVAALTAAIEQSVANLDGDGGACREIVLGTGRLPRKARVTQLCRAPAICLVIGQRQPLHSKSCRSALRASSYGEVDRRSCTSAASYDRRGERRFWDSEP